MERANAWHAAFCAIFKNLADGCNDKDVCEDCDKSDVSRLCRLVRKLHGVTRDAFKLDLASVANIASSSACDEETVAMWELIGNDAAMRSVEYCRAQCRLIPYPDNLVYRKYTGSGWCDAVIKDCFEHDNVLSSDPFGQMSETCDSTSDEADVAGSNRSYDIDSLSDRQRAIIGEAFFESGSDPSEQKYGLSMLLECARSKQESDELIRKAVEQKKMNLPNCMASLFAYRFAGRPEKMHPEKFLDDDLADLANSMNKIRGWRDRNFAAQLTQAINAASTSKDVFNELFAECLGSQWSGILLFEAGRIMEERNNYLNAWHFYEWVVENIESAAEPILDKYFKRRLAYCLDSIAYSSTAFNPDMFSLAQQRRKDLGVFADENIPKEEAYPGWQMLYFEVLGRDPSINKNYHSSKIGKGASVSKKSKVRNRKYKGNQNDSMLEKALSLAQDLNSRRKDPVALALQKNKDEQKKSELADQSAESQVPAVFAEPSQISEEHHEDLATDAIEVSGNNKHKGKNRSLNGATDFARSAVMRRAKQLMATMSKVNMKVSLGSSFFANALSGSVASDSNAVTMASGNEAVPMNEDEKLDNAIIDKANVQETDEHNEVEVSETESLTAEEIQKAAASQKEKERQKKEQEQAERAAVRAEKKRKKQAQKDEAAAKRLLRQEAKKRRLDAIAAQKLESAQKEEQLAAEEDIRKQREAEELAARVREVEEARRQNEEHAAQLRQEKIAAAAAANRMKNEGNAQVSANQNVLADTNAQEMAAAETDELSNASQSQGEAGCCIEQESEGRNGINADDASAVSLMIAATENARLNISDADAKMTKSEVKSLMDGTCPQINAQEKTLVAGNGSSEFKNRVSSANESKPGKKLFEMEIEGYKLRYHPKNGELTVLYVSDEVDLFFKMKRGDIVSGNDFILDSDDMMIRADTGAATPFRVNCTFDSVCVTIRANGVQIYFPYEDQGD